MYIDAIAELVQAFCRKAKRRRFESFSHLSTMNNKVNTYIESLLKHSGHYVPNETDQKILKNVGIPGYVKSKLVSKKYRKWRLDNECDELIDTEISNSIRESRPLKVFFSQGCYKLWRVMSSPNPNWAEFFNIAYLITYLSPIAAIYKPGVEITYYFLTVLPQTHNNLSEAEVISYKEGFIKLLNEFRKYLPDNLKVNLVTELDSRTRSKYDDELHQAMVYAEERFYSWNQAKQTDYIRRAWLNIKWNGVEPWHTLNKDQKLRIVKKAVLYEYAATQDILVKDKIGKGVILSTLPKEDSIGIGSTYTSVAKHWVGEGVLEDSGSGDFHSRILSPSQYGLAQMTPHELVDTGVIPISGFENIEVYPKSFDFTKK